MAGMGLFFPGIPDSYRNIATDEKDLSVIILGCGDCSYNRTDYTYQSVCDNYAYRYNRIMWPHLAHTMPGPALGIQPNRSNGEAYYCFNPDDSKEAPQVGAHIALLRLSINHRFDLLEGDVINNSAGYFWLHVPYTRLQGTILRKGSNYRVVYSIETPKDSKELSSSEGDAGVIFEGDNLLFQGRTYRPCPWLNDGDFYVVFAHFYYQYGQYMGHRKQA